MLQDMQAADERMLERMDERRQQHLQALLEDAREARRQEHELIRQNQMETAAFNQGFLNTFSQMVQVLASRRDQMPPS